MNPGHPGGQAPSRGRPPRTIRALVVAAFVGIGLPVACNQNPTAPTNCTAAVAVTPGTNISASSATLTATISIGSGCTWTASTSAAFLQIASASSGTGPGSVQVQVQANSGTARNGTITVGGVGVVISQAASPQPNCTFSVSSTATAVPLTGGQVAFTVVTSSECQWTASTTDPFVTILSGASNTGTNSAIVAIAANIGPARSATVLVAGTPMNVGQPASAPGQCGFVTPAVINVDWAFSIRSFFMTSPPGITCAWTATANEPWLQVVSALSGTGDVLVSLRAYTNGGFNRTGTISIAGNNVVINQGAYTSPCAFTVSPTNITISSSAQSVSVHVHVTQGNGCLIGHVTLEQSTFLNNGTLTGVHPDFDVVISIPQNTGPQRIGTVLIADKAVTIIQQ